MPTLSRRTKIIAAFIILIVIGFAFAEFWGSKNKAPADFTAARSQGAIIAQTIVNTSNSSTATLATINQEDMSGDYKDALANTNTLITQSADLRTQAVDLSNQISAMTSALNKISDSDAQQDALDAISSQLALITQLINYSTDLNKLSVALQGRFSGQAQTAGGVQSIVDQINIDINAINSYNAQSTQAMSKFDSIEKS